MTTSGADALLQRIRPGAVSGVEPLTGGHWSSAFGFVEGGRELVLRVGPHGDDFRADERAAAWSRPALPVPDVLDLGEDELGWWIVSTRARGRPLEEEPPDVDGLLGLLEALRSIEVPTDAGWGIRDAAGHGEHTSWRSFLLTVGDDSPERRTHGWRDRLAASPFGTDSFDAGLARLDELASAGGPDGPAVVHADLVNRNVLVDEGTVTGVFDWGCSFLGDPIHDLAWLAFWSPWLPAMAELDLVGAARARWDEPDLDRRLQVCMLHIALDHQAFNAFTGDVDHLAAMVGRTRELAAT